MSSLVSFRVGIWTLALPVLALASEKKVTLSSLTPVLEHIGSEILSEQAEDNSLIRQMKQVMTEDLQGRYTEQVKRVLQIASFVDARFKGSFCKNPDDTIEACVEESCESCNSSSF